MGFFTDLLGGAVDREENYRYTKKLQDNAYNLNQRSLKESPSSAKQGYEAAGLNPIAYMTNGAGATGFSSSAGMNVSSKGYGSAEGDVASAVGAVQQIKQNSENISNTQADTDLKKADAKIAQAEAESASAKAKVDAATAAPQILRAWAEESALRDAAEDGSDSTIMKLKQGIINKIEHDRYMNSREREIYHDALDGLDSVGNFATKGLSGVLKNKDINARTRDKARDRAMKRKNNNNKNKKKGK